MRKTWKNIRDAVLRFWVFKVRNRKRKEVKVTAFNVVFRDYSMSIESESGNFAMNLECTTHPFGYLAASVAQDKVDNLHGYALMMYVLATELTRDERLNRDVTNAINRHVAREEAKAAETVNESSELAALNEVAMDEKGKRLSRSARKVVKKEVANIVKEIENE